MARPPNRMVSSKAMITKGGKDTGALPPVTSSHLSDVQMVRKKPVAVPVKRADQGEQPHRAQRPNLLDLLFDLLHRHRRVYGQLGEALGPELPDGVEGGVHVGEDAQHTGVDGGHASGWPPCACLRGWASVSFTSTMDSDGITRMKPRKRRKNHAKEPAMMVESVMVGIVRTPGVRIEVVAEAGHDDVEALEPHPDQHEDRDHVERHHVVRAGAPREEHEGRRGSCRSTCPSTPTRTAWSPWRTRSPARSGRRCTTR